MVVDAGQNFLKAAGNIVQVLQGQLAIVQLAIGEYFVDQFLDQSLDA